MILALTITILYAHKYEGNPESDPHVLVDKMLTFCETLVKYSEQTAEHNDQVLKHARKEIQLTKSLRRSFDDEKEGMSIRQKS